MINARTPSLLLLIAAFAITPHLHAEETPGADTPQESVSYHTQIKPIFQAHCQGCHQPAKPLGDYIMTDFHSLLKGGESESAAVVAGDAKASYLLDQITPVDGVAAMPKEKAPLSPEQIDLVKSWIEQGAIDDTPASAIAVYDAAHPPVYSRPPVTTAIDYSPDGKLLAAAGHHEVLIHHADGSGIVARLIGVSDRIESVKFSPDGTKLAVTGGAPARMGEVQVWDVATKKLLTSVQVTYDTVYGASWSPDGTKIAFGCADNTLRVIEAATGKEVLFQGSHGDWVLDTTFSIDGAHVVSVGRDQTAKLIEFETQRFVDNITSITPGALKGGLAAVETHPARNEILIGGADGVPRTYRMERLTKRVIGDDANLVRELPATSGRIFDVAYSPDASQLAVVSSDNGTGYLTVYQYGVDGGLPDEIKKILEERVASRKPEQKKMIEDLRVEGVKLISKKQIPGRGCYAIAYHPEGKKIAVASTDGNLRIFDAGSVEQTQELAIYPTTGEQTQLAVGSSDWKFGNLNPATDEKSEVTAEIASIAITPAEIQFNDPLDYAQLVVMATLKSGDQIDVTRSVKFTVDQKFASIDPLGLLEPRSNGQTAVKVSIQGLEASLPVTISQQDAGLNVDYVHDVMPVLSKLGCNQGTCHGSAQGKAGFKLSLRGYDPIFDVRALTDDHASRRMNTAAPDESLMLLKAIGGVPHVGGQLITADHKYYQLLRNWIAGGAALDLKTPRVVSIDVFPKNPTIQSINSKQQVRVVATYADGAQRDVTYESFIESGNTEVATINSSGLLTSIRRGEAPILARHEGAYAATTLTVMGDRDEFVWQDPPTFNQIDELVANKWQRMKIQPSQLTSDAEFMRRVTLDLTGLPPTAEAVEAFIADQRPTQEKRDRYIDYLVGSEDYIAHFTNKWANLLQVNGKFLGREGANLFREWIQKQIAENRPYDEFVREILTATGSNKANPPASYFKILRDPENTMENTTHLFLGVRFNCNKCHDHPFEKWTQDQYYETAAFFAQVGLKADPESKGKNIGGTAVESGKPLYEMVVDQKQGDVIHQRTNEIAPPTFPYESTFETTEDATRREQLAAWMVAPDNRYFARSYVNRLWGYLFGIGIIEPIDDIRAGNPPTNPELLDYLTEEFINSDFDVQHIVRIICKSRTYQLSIATNKWNEDDTINFSHAQARRLPAETLFDAIHQVTGSQSHIPGVPAGTRAAALSDSQIKLEDGFLSNFGRPNRESACECERSNEVQLGPIMAMVSGKTVADAIADPNNAIPKLVNSIPGNQELIDALYLKILNRPATVKEIEVALPIFETVAESHEELEQKLEEKEAWWKSIREKKEQERLAEIQEAEKTLTDYKIELAPKRELAEQERQKKIAQAEENLAKHSESIEQPLQEWIAKQQSEASVEWQVLRPTSLVASNKADLTLQEDGSIIASVKPGLGSYELITQTDLSKVTAIRLEALTDPSLPGNGPGLGGGNFVLTEFEVFKSDLSEEKPVPHQLMLQNAQADFSQGSYDVKTAIDGQVKPNANGWAVSPQQGKTHWATFEIKNPTPVSGASEFKFILKQNYQDKNHWLGRFRISVTTAEPKIPLGLPHEVQALVKLSAEERTPEQTATLVEFYQRFDDKYIALKQAVAEAKKPLPPDAQLQNLEASLAAAKEPVKDALSVVQLRADFEMSKKLTENQRLTAAQDLTWALINSPSFLFNR
ncbi:DUF1549 domain-containing protein [uncultured Rubinisphaera sp.]|uniref:DUF1549 domain-containing protein n=1 Tax=uncultured Rubinisphaera sp. TaxID=1678686 RepID=UPI0030D8A37A